MSLSFLPRIMARTVMDLSPQLLQQRGIALLMLDFDNTIVPYTTDEPTEEMLAWLTEMAASGIQLCIVSNSKKPRVVTFAKRYGLDVMTHAHKSGRGRGADHQRWWQQRQQRGGQRQSGIYDADGDGRVPRQGNGQRV